MTALSDLIAWRDTLAAARAAGTRSVQAGDSRVEYKTDGEMAAALADLDRQISAARGQRITCVRIASSKGF